MSIKHSNNNLSITPACHFQKFGEERNEQPAITVEAHMGTFKLIVKHKKIRKAHRDIALNRIYMYN